MERNQPKDQNFKANKKQMLLPNFNRSGIAYVGIYFDGAGERPVQSEPFEPVLQKILEISE